MNQFHLKRYVPFLICVTSGLALAGFAMKQAPTFEPVTASRSIKVENLGSIDWVGACRMTPDSVDCWNTEGKSDPDLTEKIKAFYIVQNNQELRMKFGRKNRLVVFRRPSNGGSDVSITNITTPEGQYLNEAGQLGQNYSTREPYLSWYAIDVDPAETTAAVTFVVNSNIGTGTTPLKAGGEGQCGPVKVHINGIKTAPNVNRINGSGNGNISLRNWTVSISLSGIAANSGFSLYGRLMDSAGIMIERADKSGNPLPNIAPSRSSIGGYSPPPGLSAWVQSNAPLDRLNQDLSISVNPSKVSNLWLSFTGSRKVTITDILLDPKVL